MAYQDDEVGLTSGRPIELFKFSGTLNAFNLTSYSEVVISSGTQYDPAPITRNTLSVGTQEQGGEKALEITLPFDHPMVQEYAYENAPPQLLLELYRCHETDYNDTVLLWSGRVTGFSVEGRTARMKVPATFSWILQGNTPTPRFQAPCNHVLYDARCGINPALHQANATVVSVSGNSIQVDSLAMLDNEAAAGMITGPSGESRMVVSNIGTDITVTYGFATLQAGDVVTVLKGCDHALEGHCKNRFNNHERFGGFPIVPAINPFTSNIQ